MATSKALINLAAPQLSLVQRLSPVVAQHRKFLHGISQCPELKASDSNNEAAFRNAVSDYRQTLTDSWSDPDYRAPRIELPLPERAEDKSSQYDSSSAQLPQFTRYVHRLMPLVYRNDMQTLRGCRGDRDAVRNAPLIVDSLSFAEAVAAQASSSAKIVEACPLDDDTATIHAANYVRFLAFVLHVRSNTTMQVIPTLGIDLAWHAHMNHPASYAADTQALVGYIVDHKFGAEDLEGVDVAATRKRLRGLWSDHFGADAPNPYALKTGGDSSCSGGCNNGEPSSSGSWCLFGGSTSDSSGDSSCSSCGD